MRELRITSQFKKDLKKYQNQPKKIEKLDISLTNSLVSTGIVWNVTLKVTLS